MEWIAAVWNKVNKPLHFLLVGAALVLLAPPELRWTGYLFVAMGLAGSLEWGASWGASQLRNWWTIRKRLEALRNCIVTLNADEKAVLQTQVDKGEQTFYMDPFRSGGLPNHVRLAGLYRGLADKEILEMSAATPDGKVITLHVTSNAWKLLIRAFDHERK